MATPLQGIRVLDLTRLLPGPYCSLMLADHGAEVIKVEQPGQGDYIRWWPPMVNDTSGMFLVLNRNKKSITLDLKTPEAKNIFYRLVKESDVLLEGFRPGVTGRLEIDYERLKKVNPRLVYCSISGYGQDGPYALKAGHDINYIGYAGILGLTGRAGEGPALPAVQIADLGGGALMAVAGILLALLARQHTGQGQLVDISMLDGVAAWLPILAGQFFAGGDVPERGLTMLGGRYACYNVYRAGDGKYIALGALEEWFWEKLCRHLGREDYIPLQFADQRQEEIIDFLNSTFSSKSRDQWVEELSKVDICCSPVYDFPEVFDDPQLKHRQMVLESEHPALGKVRQLGFPIKLSGTPAGLHRHAPALGEHTEEILSRLGYTAEEISRFKKNRVV